MVKSPLYSNVWWGFFSVTVCNAMAVYAAHFAIDIPSIGVYTIN